MCSRCGAPKEAGRGKRLCAACRIVPSPTKTPEARRHPCKRCGKPKEPGKRRKLCDACQVLAQAEKTPEGRRGPCWHCGGRKGPGRNKYCDTCRPIATRENHLARKKRDWEKHRDERCAAKRDYYAANTEIILERGRERYATNPTAASIARANAQRWREENPEQYRDLHRKNAAKRRARKRTADVTAIEPLVVLERDDGACDICRNDVDPMAFHLDHVWPLARGGAHTYDNVQVAHPDCNMRKGWSV